MFLSENRTLAKMIDNRVKGKGSGRLIICSVDLKNILQLMVK